MTVRKKRTEHVGCLLCGKPIVYSQRSSPRTCALCGGVFESGAACEAGHYICDKCHASAGRDLPALLRNAGEGDPLKLFRQVTALPGVHMHGPEHHAIVPFVLLTAYRNCGGKLDLDAALGIAAERGAQVPGGVCGFWGACGAAVGAGIYASILTGSSPLNAKVWSLPQRLTARCLERIAELGGPRCCKRTSRLAIEEAVRFTREHFGVEMPAEPFPCDHHGENAECLHGRCPYYPINGEI